MGKNSHKKKYKEDMGNVKLPDLSEDKLIDIQAEAYYRALKRIEEEKQKANIETFETKDKSYPRWKLALNITFFPIKISKKYTMPSNAYENILVALVSNALMGLGLFLWILGLLFIPYSIYQIIRGEISLPIFIIEIILGLELSFLAGTLFQAGKIFGEETDSNKIYAFSSSIIGVFGCIIAVVAILL